MGGVPGSATHGGRPLVYVGVEVDDTAALLDAERWRELTEDDTRPMPWRYCRNDSRAKIPGTEEDMRSTAALTRLCARENCGHLHTRRGGARRASHRCGRIRR